MSGTSVINIIYKYIINKNVINEWQNDLYNTYIENMSIYKSKGRIIGTFKTVISRSHLYALLNMIIYMESTLKEGMSKYYSLSKILKL